MDDEYEQERQKEPEFQNQPWVIYVVFGGLLLFSGVFLAMWIVPKTHILFEASCSPLEDPKLHEKTIDGVIHVYMLLRAARHIVRSFVHTAFVCATFSMEIFSMVVADDHVVHP
jgi:hypothetical protein